jgi:hypothetical protein
MVDSSTNENYETPERKGDEDLPPPELKHLPPDLKYRFLDETNKYLVVVSTNLSEQEEKQLMMVLKMHRKAFGYSLDDLQEVPQSPLIKYSWKMEPNPWLIFKENLNLR